MSDDKTKRGEPDRSLINVHEPYELRDWSNRLGVTEERLKTAVQLVGPDSLQESDRLILEVSRMLRDGFLQQNATSETDASCSLEKQHGMLTLFIAFHELAVLALQAKVPLDKILSLPEREELARLREISAPDFPARGADIGERMRASFSALKVEGYRQ